jgi:internalin A
VLNPHWLTTGIYTLLNSKRLAARKGELTPADLAKELDAKKYPAAMHPFLINLMEKFELCFSFDEPLQPSAKMARRSPADVASPAVWLAARYLIPELLDPEQPAIAAQDFDEAKCLNFPYRYPVLPPGLLPRFIVRTHVLSEEHRWKTGVILQFDGNTALVKADPQEKTIRILIYGPVEGRRRMLGVIRQDFDVIHRDVPHLKPEELVSFPTAPQITVSYVELEVLYADDPHTPIKRVVDGKVDTATVRELLEGVEFAPLDEALRSTPRKARRTRRMADEFEAERDPRPLRVFYSYSRVDANVEVVIAVGAAGADQHVVRQRSPARCRIRQRDRRQAG